MTTLRLPAGPPSARMHEFAAALAANLDLGAVRVVHVILQGESGGCGRLSALVAEIAAASLHKLRCVFTQREPTYAQLFVHANASTATDGHHPVALVNADVVFDESLGLLAAANYAGGRRGFVLSVTPPQSEHGEAGRYLRYVGRECSSAANVDNGLLRLDDRNSTMSNAPRCVLGGWDGGVWGALHAGNSWDAFVLALPLSRHIDLRRLDHTTHKLGSENRAAFELISRGGIRLHNPCLHVRASHWHCAAGKSHSSVTLPRKQDSIFNLFPCWDCPGVPMPGGRHPGSALCRDGTKIAPRGLAKLVRQDRATDVKLCCARLESLVCNTTRAAGASFSSCVVGNQEARARACSTRLKLKRLSRAAPRLSLLCEKPADVDCVLLRTCYTPQIK